MFLTLDSLCICIECQCMVMGPHRCEPMTDKPNALARIVFLIHREEEIARLAKARR